MRILQIRIRIRIPNTYQNRRERTCPLPCLRFERKSARSFWSGSTDFSALSASSLKARVSIPKYSSTPVQTGVCCFSREQGCGSGMFILDPKSEFFPSRIQVKKISESRIRIRTKKFKYFNPKMFLSSRKYDLGCSSRIRILIFYPSRIPDTGAKKAPDTGSGPQHCQGVS